MACQNRSESRTDHQLIVHNKHNVQEMQLEKQEKQQEMVKELRVK